MASKTNVVILFGGRSGEHEVSRASAAFIIDTLRQMEDFRVLPVGITREGRWYAYSGDTGPMRDGRWFEEGPVFPAALLPDTGRHFLYINREGGTVTYEADCVFPVLHGPNGEDGTIQGMLEMAGIPFVGCGMAASVLAMDKSLANTLFDKHGIPHTPWRLVDRAVWEKTEGLPEESLTRGLAYPLFVKPARGGSSLGISRVDRPGALPAALSHAFSYDRKVLIEEAVQGRELEIAALGGYGKPFLSPVGEIVPDRDFYDYDSKYESGSASRLLVPAELDRKTEEEIRRIAELAWRALDCYGLSRIDFFLAANGQVYLNEINTIPGFVDISMYPRLMRAAGFRDTDLVRRLIELAFSREDK